MKCVVLTGAASDTGLAICEALLKNGYAVIGVDRGAENCAAVLEKLKDKYPEAYIVLLQANLAEQSETLHIANMVNQLVKKELGGKLHALIHNTGYICNWYVMTNDGIEQQFAQNYLAGFLLTNKLLPILGHSDARVILASSQLHKRIKMQWEDPMFSRRYRPLLAYKQTELMNLLLALHLNTLGIQAYGADVRQLSAEQAAQTYLLLCETMPYGLYFSDSAPRKTSAEVNEENAERLYELSARLCGLDGRLAV